MFSIKLRDLKNIDNICLIKNASKYPKLKLAKGVNLNIKNTSNRLAHLRSIGISSKKYGHYWFNTPKGQALFKTFNSEYSKEVRNLRMLNEILCFRLAKKLNINCAEYEPAYIYNKNNTNSRSKKDDGIITYNFLNDDDSFLSIYDFLREHNTSVDLSFKGICKTIDNHSKFGFNLNKEEMICDIYKQLLFDIITFQTDRNFFNIGVIYNCNTNSYKIAPMFDNEFAFLGLELPKYIKSDKQSNAKIVLEEYGKYTDIFAIDSFKGVINKYNKQIEYLCEYALNNPKLNEIFKNIVKNFDIYGVYDELKKEGYKINNDYREFTQLLTDISRKKLVTKYNKMRKCKNKHKIDVDKTTSKNLTS